MNSNLEISIFQIDLAYKDKSKNYNNIDLLSEKINKTDLILLPEMFNTSFVPSDVSLAEKMNGPSIKWMKSLSCLHPDQYSRLLNLLRAKYAELVKRGKIDPKKN